MNRVCKLLGRAAGGLLVSAVSFASAPADAPKVVASIMPLHSLVAGVMEGIGEPSLLVKGGGSPHAYSLRPSEAKGLQEAAVIFWIGEEMETFLEKPLQALPRDARVVALHEADGVTLLPSGQGDGRGKHAAGQYDMHIWLDPENAKAMVAAIVTALCDSDPANASRYWANGTALQKRLRDLDAGLKGDLAAVKERPYVVFHDAYRYFEQHYRLNPAGTITVSPDRQPSAQALVEIRKKIVETGAGCVFSEPQFEPAVVATVIEGTGARAGVLDPLGADLKPGPHAYFDMMRGLAASLRECLMRSE